MKKPGSMLIYWRVEAIPWWKKQGFSPTAWGQGMLLILWRSPASAWSPLLLWVSIGGVLLYKKKCRFILSIGDFITLITGLGLVGATPAGLSQKWGNHQFIAFFALTKIPAHCNFILNMMINLSFGARWSKYIFIHGNVVPDVHETPGVAGVVLKCPSLGDSFGIRQIRPSCTVRSSATGSSRRACPRMPGRGTAHGQRQGFFIVKSMSLGVHPHVRDQNKI